MANPCNERVGKGIITFACDVEAGHTGPHRALENQPSVRERQKWQEAENAKATLATFQGEAQTTAQRYTENPTAVPNKPLVDVVPYEQAHAAATEDEMPEATQSWEVPAHNGSGRITRLPGGVFTLIVDGKNEPVEISQKDALRLLSPKPSEIGPAHPGYAQAAAMRFAVPPTKPRSSDPWSPYRQVEGEMHRHGYGTRSEGGDLTHTHEGGDREHVHHGEEAKVPTKQREGDQVLPTVNDHPDIQSQVIADIEARREVGISRYGTALQPFNGRDMLLDAYEEAMDLCIYLKGCLVERDHG